MVVVIIRELTIEVKPYLPMPWPKTPNLPLERPKQYELQRGCSLQPNAIPYKQCVDEMSMSDTRWPASIELVNGILHIETKMLDQVTGDQEPSPVVAIVAVNTNQWTRQGFLLIRTLLHLLVNLLLKFTDQSDEVSRFIWGRGNLGHSRMFAIANPTLLHFSRIVHRAFMTDVDNGVDAIVILCRECHRIVFLVNLTQHLHRSESIGYGFRNWRNLLPLGKVLDIPLSRSVHTLQLPAQTKTLVNVRREEILHNSRKCAVCRPVIEQCMGCWCR